MSIRLLPKFSPRSDEQRHADFEKSLLRREAQIGGTLFGPVAKGHHRQFFCLDQYTWIWHEDWKNAKGLQQSVTTRYEVRPGGIIKSQNGQPYQRLTREERRNLYKAVGLYGERVTADYHQRLQTI